MLQNKEEAEDILQDVFLKLWTNKHKLDAYTSVEAYAMCICKNLCLDRLKARKGKNMVDLTDLQINSEAVSPYQQSELNDQVDKVQELLGALPENQKVVLHLRDVEGYSFEELEQITGLTLNNLRVVLSRARKSVRDGLLKIENYEVG